MLRRSLRSLSQADWFYRCNKIKSHCKTASILYSTIDKDFPNPSLPTPLTRVTSHDQDILLEQIRKTKSTNRLLELISMHLEVMNAKHIVESMQVIHDLSKQQHFNNEDLLENKTFQGLCSQLMKIVRLLDSQEVITVFKTLSTLGVRSNTYVMQAILKMMGAHLNSMPLGQLIFLNFLLNKQKHNSLVDGLKLALPLVLQVQIEQQLDTDNVDEIVSCLQLACKSRLKPSIIEKVFAAVLQKANMLSTSNAVSVAFALMNLETPVDGYKALLNYCFDILSKDAVSLNHKQTISLVRLCRNQGHYNTRFLFSVADKVVSEKWNFGATYDMVSAFYRMSFAPQYLVDYFAEVMCSESKVLRTKLDYSPLNCIEYITLTGYHPPNVGEVVDVLCSCQSKISAMSERSNNLLIKLISCITMLGHFPGEYLKKILNEDILFNAWSLSKKQGRVNEYEIHVLALIWSLVTYDQQEAFKFPPAFLHKLLTTRYQKYENYQSPLENFIQHGLGGSQFLQSGLFTNDGIFIDHVVAMRSGNYPVSFQPPKENESHPLISSGIKFVEDISLPDDTKIVPVIIAQDENYCRDPFVLKGWVDIKIRCLLKKKYYPVVVNYALFKEMPDREKIPFLMREIKQAVEEDNSSKYTTLS